MNTNFHQFRSDITNLQNKDYKELGDIETAASLEESKGTEVVDQALTHEIGSGKIDQTTKEAAPTTVTNIFSKSNNAEKGLAQATTLKSLNTGIEKGVKRTPFKEIENLRTTKSFLTD